MTTPLLTDADLATRYAKSRYFVQEQCRAKRWPHLRVGQSLRFTEAHVAAIDALLEVESAEADPLPAAGKGNRWGRKGRAS